MPQTRTYEAIVLASYDVGEADRFLILLTRERGRLAARASGVRRPRSRLTGILPLEHLSLDMRENRGVFLVTSVHRREFRHRSKGIEDFLTGMQASELLLSLLHDEEPLPQIFDALASFLRRKQRQPHHFLSFAFHTLALLGVLSLEPEGGKILGRLSDGERRFLKESTRGRFPENCPPLHRLTLLCTKIVGEHATRPLKSTYVAAACA